MIPDPESDPVKCGFVTPIDLLCFWHGIRIQSWSFDRLMITDLDLDPVQSGIRIISKLQSREGEAEGAVAAVPEVPGGREGGIRGDALSRAGLRATPGRHHFSKA